MRKFMLPLALFAFVAILFSCKKEDPAPTKTELLTAKNWKLTAATIDPALPIAGTGGLQTTNDYYTHFLATCQKDDFVSFYTDLKLIQDEGVTKCNTTGPQTYAGSWAWLAGETQLQTMLNGTTRNYTISQLDATTLKGAYSTNLGTTSYTITETWTNQ